jgi:hypothetical protein
MSADPMQPTNYGRKILLWRGGNISAKNEATEFKFTLTPVVALED